MNAGLPGTGIGGAFYLLSALLMPFHAIYKTLRKKNQPQRIRLILVQSSIALGIIAGIWLTGWLLGELRVMVDTWLALKRGIAVPPPSALPNVIKVTLIFLTIGLLAVVISGVHILKLVMRYRKPRHPINGRIKPERAFKPAAVVDSRFSLGEMPYANPRDSMIERTVNRVAP